MQLTDPQTMIRSEQTVTLQHTLAATAAYIPDRLVHAQLATPRPGRIHGAFWHGSLLFADLSGFTALSESLSVLGRQGSEEISAVINHLFAVLIAEVSTHHGMLLKFGGDALTAFFDAERLGPLHAAAATHAALAIQSRMADFAALETRAGTFALGLRVGVHSGRVFAAEVGDIHHIELVVTGPEVNRVVCAQQIAHPGEVVVSDQTARLLHQARLSPRGNGFHRISALEPVTLPPDLPGPLLRHVVFSRLSVACIETQLAALRPYLIHNLPQRFLDPTIPEKGEFRPVTVLFANFHDFSAILTALAHDEASAAAVLNAYFCRVQQVVHRYDGIVNKVDMHSHGDKLMALFGAPSAHEDDSFRAVRCALDLQTALEEANTEIETILIRAGCHCADTLRLKQRIGINTGTVFAGRVGGSQRYEYTVMGPAVNLAARLMSKADDGTILLSPATRKAVEHQVAVEDHVPLQLKGVAHPILPVRLLGITSEEMYYRPPLVPTATTTAPQRRQLVGRSGEMEQLIADASAALRGSARGIALVGEAGIGKTRLAEELVRCLIMKSLESMRMGDEGVPAFQIYTNDCLSYEHHTPYSALRPVLRHLLGIHHDDVSDPNHLVFALKEQIAQLAPRLVRFASLLGDALGITLSETALTRHLTPEQRHARLQELIVSLVVGAASQRGPLLLFLDSVNWADASSLELVKRLVQTTASHHNYAPILLLLCYRADQHIDALWVELPNTTRVVLRELSTPNCEALLTELLGGKPPPSMLPLLDRTQGNPFFIEEVVRALVDSGALTKDDSGTWQFTQPPNDETLPNSIEGLLIARLDRLEEQQYELVQMASVIGQHFDHLLIEKVYESLKRSGKTTLSRQLQSLIIADIITIAQQPDRPYSGDTPPVYLFRHTLLRDVAYEGILYVRRRELHQRVAECIEATEPVHRDEHLAVLAQHYLLAEMWEPAFKNHLAAAVQAQKRYANHDALALLQSARRIIPHFEGDDERFSQAIEVYERSGDIHVLLGEYDEAQAMYLNALALLNGWRKQYNLWRGETEQRRIQLPTPFALLNMRLHRLMAIVHERRADYETAYDWLSRGISWSNAETLDELGRCYLLGAGICQRQGQYIRSIKWAEQGLRVAEQRANDCDMAHAYSLLGSTYHKLGRTQESLTAGEKSLRLYQAIGDIQGQSDAHLNLLNVLTCAGRWQEAIEHGRAALSLKEIVGDVQGKAILANNLGDLQRQMGDYESAIRSFQVALEQFKMLGSDYGMAVLHMNIASVRLHQDDMVSTRQHLEQSKWLFERTGTQDFLAELCCTYAQLELAEYHLTEALRWADVSLTIAQQLEARADEGAARRVRGLILRASGAHREAMIELRRACTILAEVGNQYGEAQCLEELAYTTDDQSEATRALAESQRIRHDLSAAVGNVAYV